CCDTRCNAFFLNYLVLAEILRYNMVVKSNEARRLAQRNSFLNIAQTLQSRIESGEIEKGRLLPTEREIQEEFGVSRSTVRRALARLTETGWV
ncbi:MAG: winged helix-turn-helix domain-containing protein, partial [Armatimonadota bacterium]